MKHGGRRWYPAVIVAAALAVVVVPVGAQAQTRLVNCGAHQSVTAALKLPSVQALVVRVRGTCNEAVTIARDDVTLIADSAGAGITQSDPSSNTILIDGAKNVVIDGLIVSGARNGVVGRNGAVFTVQNATIQNNAQQGIVAIFNSTVTVQNSVVTNNGTTGDKELGTSGILIADSSAGTILGTTITNNGHTETIPDLETVRQPGRFGSGINVHRGSSARIGRASTGALGPNSITGNAGNGIGVFQDSASQVWGNTINANGGTGVNVEGGSATIVLNDISNNGGDGVNVTNGGGARIGYDDATIAMFRLDCSCTNKIHGNGTNGAADLRKVGHGIEITNGANATFHGNLIENSTGSGVNISNASGRAAGGNIIRNNGDNGVQVSRGQFLQGKFSILGPFKDQITGNGLNKRDEPSSGFGVLIFGDSSATLLTFLISGNRRDGVQVYSGASATLRSEDPTQISVIENNGTGPNDGTPGTGTGPAPFSSMGNGVSVTNNAVVEARGIVIRNNKTNGISLSGGAKAILRAHVISFSCPGNCYDTTMRTEVYGNGSNGINVFNGSSVDISKGTWIHDNGSQTLNGSDTCNSTVTAGSFCTGNGIAASINSSVNMIDSTIEHNVATGISLFGNSTLQIGASSALFPSVGNYPNGLQSFVRNNGLDGITAFGNSVINSISASNTALNGAQLKTIVTGNGRNGLSCGTQSRVQGDLSGISGNHVSFPGSDLSGSTLGTTTINDFTNTPRTVVTTFGLSTNGGSCF